MTAGLKVLRPAVPNGSAGRLLHRTKCVGCHFREDPRRARDLPCRFGADGSLELEIRQMFRPIAQLEDLLVDRSPFVYSLQRGTVGEITDLADRDPDTDDIELLEVQYW